MYVCGASPGLCNDKRCICGVFLAVCTERKQGGTLHPEVSQSDELHILDRILEVRGFLFSRGIININGLFCAVAYLISLG